MKVAPHRARARASYESPAEYSRPHAPVSPPRRCARCRARRADAPCCSAVRAAPRFAQRRASDFSSAAIRRLFCPISSSSLSTRAAVCRVELPDAQCAETFVACTLQPPQTRHFARRRVPENARTTFRRFREDHIEIAAKGKLLVVRQHRACFAARAALAVFLRHREHLVEALESFRVSSEPCVQLRPNANRVDDAAHVVHGKAGGHSLRDAASTPPRDPRGCTGRTQRGIARGPAFRRCKHGAWGRAGPPPAPCDTRRWLPVNPGCGSSRAPDRGACAPAGPAPAPAEPLPCAARRRAPCCRRRAPPGQPMPAPRRRPSHPFHRARA